MYPGSYPPQPPYYGHLGDPNAAAAAAANQMNGYPPYPSYYSAQFGYPAPYEQYPPNPAPASYAPGSHMQGANAPVKREEGLVPAAQGSGMMAVPPVSADEQKPLEPLSVFKGSSHSNTGPHYE